MDDAKLTVIQRMMALRAKIGNRGSTEAEVESAARMFAKLSVQHDIDESMLQDKAIEKGAIAKWGRPGTKLPDVVSYVFSAIEEYTETKCWNNRGQLHFAGREADVEMAVYLTEIAVGASKRGYLRYSAFQMGQGAQRMNQLRLGFYAGFGTGLALALRAAMADKIAEREEAMGQSNSTALVVVKGQLAKDVMAENGIVLRKASHKSSVHMDYGSYVAGKEASSKVNINRPLGDK